jgi:hypothetical protein
MIVFSLLVEYQFNAWTLIELSEDNGPSPYSA